MDNIAWSRWRTGFVASALVALAGAASAGPVFEISITGGEGGTYLFSGEATDPDGDGLFTRSGHADGSSFVGDWATGINPDPALQFNFTLKNLSSQTQSFVMTITMPIAPIGPGTRQGGFVGDITYTDTSGDRSVTVSPDGTDPFYSAMVNGVVSHDISIPILNAQGFAGISGSLARQSWGEPIPSAPFGPAAVNMRIRTAFTLTSQDTVDYAGLFVIKPGEAVPESGTLALVAVGLVALAALRLRA